MESTLKMSTATERLVLLGLWFLVFGQVLSQPVEYEFWTSSHHECGRGKLCSSPIEFIKDFKGVAQLLEQKGYTHFTPRYLTWFRPEAFVSSKECRSRCINHGRYCQWEFMDYGYDGKDVVVQNLRQSCFFKLANESGRPWLWWDYVTDFAIRCPMSEKRYNKECADQDIQSLGFHIKKIDECIGDPYADADHPILKLEQQAQIDEGPRGDITILPTLVINNKQYRGKLDRGAVLKTICASLTEITDPSICLHGDTQTKRCLDDDNGGCWQHKSSNITACKDTSRGRVCECPTVQGIKLTGDGYTHCRDSRYVFDNGGCWKETRDGRTYSACIEGLTEGNHCRCPPGFTGNGVFCEDVDECKSRVACQCPECKCKNTWSHGGDLWYLQERKEQFSKSGSAAGTRYEENTITDFRPGLLWDFILLLAVAIGFGGYAIFIAHIHISGSRFENAR